MRWTIALASLVAVAAAQAGDVTPMHPAGHHMDANGDGMISRDEAKASPRLSETFDAWDTNKDGTLDQAEMTAHRDAMRGEMRAKANERWTAADTDGNGSLSREEAKASMPHLADNFDKMDGNQDGQLSRDEMHNFRMQDKKHMRYEAAERFKGADTDGDGALDLAEAQTGMPGLAERFTAVDKNGDGKITPDELKAGRKQR